MASTEEKARLIQLVLTDCDGVLTDGGVYYSHQGEVLKRFNIRDGMGVERLRILAGVETGIISGEHSGSIAQRAKKLNITECHLGIKAKTDVLREIVHRRGIPSWAIAYIGDDMNDLEVFSMVGFTACPADAMEPVRKKATIICRNKGGEGAFREFAEIIIAAYLKGS